MSGKETNCLKKGELTDNSIYITLTINDNKNNQTIKVDNAKYQQKFGYRESNPGLQNENLGG